VVEEEQVAPHLLEERIEGEERKREKREWVCFHAN